MARSLSKIQEQIAKLQKEADSIQSGVIARIKKEIAQFGLSAEHLFGTSTATSGSRTRAQSKITQAKASKKGADKPAKYADDQGNSWHGIGKRPAWIHAALDAGRSLDDFLVDGTQQRASAKRAAAKATPKAGKKAAVRKTSASANKAAKPAGAKKAAKPAAAKRTAARKPAKSSAAEAADVAKVAA